MRKLTDHQIPGLSETIEIEVLDQPGHGGACHRYAIRPTQVVNEHTPNGSQILRASCVIRFQNGPIKEHGLNGITEDVLLTVLIDRLRSFQAGPFASPDNANTLHHLEAALNSNQKRTKERLARQVEGTSAA